MRLPICQEWSHITKLFFMGILGVGGQVLLAFRDVIALPAVGSRAETSWDLPDTSMVAVLSVGLVVCRVPILTGIHWDKVGQPHCDMTKNDGEEPKSYPNNLIQVLNMLQFKQIHFCLDKPYKVILGSIVLATLALNPMRSICQHSFFPVMVNRIHACCVSCVVFLVTSGRSSSKPEIVLLESPLWIPDGKTW